jgi:hypothetical protein
MFQVIVRLQDGDEADAGVFESRAAADERAAALIESIDAGQWLTLDNRFIRSTVVASIDVHEGRAPRWRGSETRQRWADEEESASP